MIEADYNRWLELKREIENFEKISESNKKQIYEVEQELKEHEEVNLVKIDYFPEDDDGPESFIYHFKWIGYKKEIERITKEFNYSIEQAEDIVERAGHENMFHIISSYIYLRENDDIYV